MTEVLIEFLRARFAEDEADRRAHPDPAWVLAEVEAKRRIVNCVADDTALYELLSQVDPLDLEDYTAGAVWGLTFALRSLAAVYAAHPDYRDEWRIEKSTLLPAPVSDRDDDDALAAEYDRARGYDLPPDARPEVRADVQPGG